MLEVLRKPRKCLEKQKFLSSEPSPIGWGYRTLPNSFPERKKVRCGSPYISILAQVYISRESFFEEEPLKSRGCAVPRLDLWEINHNVKKRHLKKTFI
jgi:hypothetical protein